MLARGLAARALGDDLGVSRRLLVERVERLRQVVEQAREIHGGALEVKRGARGVDAAYATLRTEAPAVIHELLDRLAE